MKELLPETQVLEGARRAIYHTEKDENIQQQMAVYGFTPKYRQHGKNLLAKVLLLQAVRMSHDDEWGSSIQKIRADIQVARTMFRDHVHAARKAFQHDPAVLQKLKIQHIARKRKEWMQQALHFYILLEGDVARLEPLGIERSVIVQARVSIQALLEIKESRILKKSAVNDCAGEKNQQAEAKYFKALTAWVMEFQSVARVAFKDNPQLLEIFGVSILTKV